MRIGFLAPFYRIHYHVLYTNKTNKNDTKPVLEFEKNLDYRRVGFNKVQRSTKLMYTYKKKRRDSKLLSMQPVT